VKRRIFLLGISLLVTPLRAQENFDVLVYGGTPGGLIAAVAAARMGNTVAVLEPSRHLGGMMSGGLTRTDIGRPETIGGLAREFFDRVLAYYRQTYGADSPQVRDCRNGYYFEPHVAEELFVAMLAEQPTLRVFRQHRLSSVQRDGDRITAVRVDDLSTGQVVTFRGRVFIDASYEGDLMAYAGVPHRLGREASYEYDEPHAGFRAEEWGGVGRYDHAIQAYNFRLCLTQREDLRVLVEKPANYDPANYARLREYVRRYNVTQVNDRLLSILPVPNGKYDANNQPNGWQSSDFVGANQNYPQADAVTRESIVLAHREYQQGLLYFLQNDPDLPEALRADARSWGLAKDEFVDNGHWPHQLYIREARRMVGQYVLREQDITTERFKPDGVALGSYMLDSHATWALPRRDGTWILEGGLGVPTEPYEIPYRCLTPQNTTNLLVPVCLSATHVAYCSVRMEPVYMMLGHAAGLAAHLACEQGTSVQEVPVDRLRALLREQKALLEANFRPRADFRAEPGMQVAVGQTVTFTSAPAEVRSETVRWWWDVDGDGQVDATEATVTHAFDRPGRYSVGLIIEDRDGRRSDPAYRSVTVGDGGPEEVVLDDPEAQFVGWWVKSNSNRGFVGTAYQHDRNQNKGQQWARYTPNLTAAGRYLVCVSYTSDPNRASNVPITIHHHDGETVVPVNQRTKDTPFPFVPLGEYVFAAGTDGFVEIGTADTDGYVIADAVKWVWQGK